MLQKNEIVTIEITGVTNEGNGVGRSGGIAVFVPMTAIGDTIEAKVVKVGKNHAYAIVNRVITPSPDRIGDGCECYRRCGGCSLRHIGYGREAAIKSGWIEESLRRIGGVDLAAVEIDEALPSPEASRYRNKAQYPVRLVDGKIRAGFFAKRTHELVPVKDCLLEPEFFSGIVDAVVEFMEEFSLSPYDEAANAGLLRHIFIRYAEASDEAMLCLVINARKLPHADNLIKSLAKKCPKVKTVVTNENRSRTNVIFGARTAVISGSGYITDKLCGISVNLSAQSFYQVNRASAERLYNKALEYANPKESDVLLDLYCGAGTIGLSMAHRVHRLIGVEIVEDAIKNAEQNAAQNGIANASFICADALDAAKRLEADGIKPDTIVLDPPRKGADEKLIGVIAGLAPEKLVYISCNPATLARDVARLRGVGFELKRVCAVDLFPRTAHIECVALLVKL